MRIAIAAFGRPAPQGSHDLGSAGQFLDASPYLAAWRTAVRIGAFKAYAELGIGADALPLFPAGTPVQIEECTFYVGTTPTAKPDIDKLLRATLDGLGGGRGKTARVFADDSQVTMIRELSKTRANNGRTGAYIVISDGRD
jgi:hypothetical protein